ncbi:tetratricopeptide repeat protein [Acidihalobacter aeolianus]|uniref:tetratricopeptide repeat protein n=1 Tax=Acidihalobacter aeolianus TaxID=2792603 RepID=UPI0009F1E013|nr:tetratricopeptide repeat protein [Acidihalobacter aeolianus]
MAPEFYHLTPQFGYGGVEHVAGQNLRKMIPISYCHLSADNMLPIYALITNETVAVAYQDRLSLKHSEFAKKLTELKKMTAREIANTQYRRGAWFDPMQTKIGNKNQKSWKQANYWYRKSAANGSAKAQCRLARDYARGLGFPASATKAIYWYRRSADQGNPIAEVNMAIAYANGIDVHSDPHRVVYWFRKAALQSNIMAENNLGIAYELGRGVHRNYNKAIHWFSLAASKGDARAQYNLGSMYFRGLGVSKNMRLADYWLNKSAAQGDYSAKSALRHIKYIAKEKTTVAYHNKKENKNTRGN